MQKNITFRHFSANGISAVLQRMNLFQIVASSSKEEINSVPPPPSTSDAKDDELKQKEPSGDGEEDTARKVSGR